MAAAEGGRKLRVLTDIIMEDVAEFERVSFQEYYKSRSPAAWSAYDSIGEEGIKDMLFDEWEHIKLPKRSTSGSAGYDFYLPHSLLLDESPKMIYTGVCCDIDPGWVLMLFPRSGLGYKYGVRLSNAVGVIDSDYYGNPDNEGHISAKMYAADKPVRLDVGDRFMQGVFVPFGVAVDDAPLGVRVGGTGSTGT